MKAKAIILDLDDTLISTPYRQYRCIADFFTHAGQPFIAFEEYRQRRRLGQLSNSALIRSLGIEPDWIAFEEYYRTNIESVKYLAYDQLLVDRMLLDKAVGKHFALVLLSLRSNPDTSRMQLQSLGLADFFQEIVFEKHSTASNPKLRWLEAWKDKFGIVAFCGDSMSDYEAARQLNINFVQVRTSLYQLPDFEQARHFDDINQYLSAIL